MKCECGETDINKFTRHKASRSGYQKLCKKCFKDRYWEPKRRMYDGVTCEVDGCQNQAVTRNLCRRHYKQCYDHGVTYEGRSRKWETKPKPTYIPTDSIPWPATTSPLLEVK